MNRLKTSGIIFVLILTACVVAFVVHAFADHNLTKPRAISELICTTTGQNHIIIIHGDTATPSHVEGRLCDTLTITNTDDQIRLVAFGEHEHHQAYDDIIEKVLQKGQRLTVSLNRAGTYNFHDHLNDSAQGSFTVSIN